MTTLRSTFTPAPCRCGTAPFTGWLLGSHWRSFACTGGWRNALPLVVSLALCLWSSVLLAPLSARAADVTHYVWANSPDPTAPYTGWVTAAHTIQDAINAAVSGDTVLVSNGTYNVGGAVTPDYALSNRVCITSAITLQSVNGPSVTSIVGAPDPSGGVGSNAVRCLYLGADAVVNGFTLTNGYTMDAKYPGETEDFSGAGALLDGGGTLTNCVIAANTTSADGGGVCCFAGGALNNCVVTNNTAQGGLGGGVCCYGDAGAALNNCVIVANSASEDGGGVYCHDTDVLSNCVVAGNSSSKNGGGVFCYAGGALNNCVVTNNAAGRNASGGGGVMCWNGGALCGCLLAGNVATYSGGGVACNYGGASSGGALTNCTITANSVPGQSVLRRRRPGLLRERPRRELHRVGE